MAIDVRTAATAASVDPAARKRTGSSSTTPSAATIDDLPNELLLSILPFLDLKALVAAQGVNRHWRALVREAHLHPVRRGLLALFDAVVRAAPAGHGRPRVSRERCGASREEYLQFLTHGADAPADFAMWVREWPAWGVYGWLWPALDERTPLPVPPSRALLAQCAHMDGFAPWGMGAAGWSEPGAKEKPHVKCITFVGGRTPWEGGAVLRATRILPIEFANIVSAQGMNMSEVEEEEESIEVTVLVFGGGNRSLILDGKRGGEEMKGCVYAVVESYTVYKDTVFARTWTEYLRKYLLDPHPSSPPEMLTGVYPFTP